MKWNEKYLKIGCFASLALLVGTVAVSFVILNRMMIMWGSPRVFVSKPTAQGIAHEAWLLEEGSVDRGWYLLVRDDASQKPREVKEIDLGINPEFSGIEWSRDGVLLVVTMRSWTGSNKESRMYSYDFSEDKAIVSPGVADALQYGYDSRGQNLNSRLHQEKADQEKKEEPNFTELLAEHGGPEGPMVTMQQMKVQGRELTYREWMELRKQLGMH